MAHYRFTKQDRAKATKTRAQMKQAETHDNYDVGDMADWQAVYGWARYDTGRRVAPHGRAL